MNIFSNKFTVTRFGAGYTRIAFFEVIDGNGTREERGSVVLMNSDADDLQRLLESKLRKPGGAPGPKPPPAPVPARVG